MNDVLWFAVGVLAGIPIGLMFRESADLIRRRDKELTAMRDWLRTNQIVGLTLALIFSTLFTGGVGVLVLVSNGDRADLTRCLSSYNERVGKARDERTEAANQVAAAEEIYVRADLQYQRDLLAVLRTGGDTGQLAGIVDVRLDANRRYLETLKAATKVRAENEYPPPNLCETP